MTSRARLVVLALTVLVTWALVGAASALACPRDPYVPVSEPKIYATNVAFYLDRVEVTVCVEGLLQGTVPPLTSKVTIDIYGNVRSKLQGVESSSGRFEKIGSFRSSAENGENAYVVPRKLRAKIKRRDRIRVKMTLRDPEGKKADTAREDAKVPR